MRCRSGWSWLLAVAAMTVHAADPGDVLVASTGDREVLVMPTAAPYPASVVRGVRMEVAQEDGFRVYRASHQGRTYTVRSLVDGPVQRFAFDPRARRFIELTSVLRVRMKNADRLAEVAADAGAVRHWNFPGLGWAFLRLPEDVNPALVAQRLADNPLVERAEVQLAEPVMVPQ